MAEQPSLEPVARALNLIPVTLKEAALDSPTFRSTAVHLSDQIESIERWLEGYVKAGTKLAHEIASMEGLINNYLQVSTPPAQISEAVLDHDYTLLATKRYGEAQREFWTATLRHIKKAETTVYEPIKAFISNELRWFKDARKSLEQAQRAFDSVLARYAGQAKTKEASSLREDAFQLHEARKAYLKASMDFCLQAPQVRASLDKLLVRVFSDQWKEIRTSRESNTVMFNKYGAEMDRVKGWGKEMENSERAFKRELQIARRQIEDSAEQVIRPSRELDDYTAFTVPYLGSGGANLTSPRKPGVEPAEKQGWLFLKGITGKPARTVWSRRWFFVKNGIFGWLVQGVRSGGVEESEKVGVLLCSVRPAVQEERRFCFEVKTKDTSIILQAETQAELTQWISTFEVAKRKAVEDPASTETSPATPGIDPAFAITQPIAPEFAAKTDGHMGQGSEDGGGGLSAPEGNALASRSSFDVTSSSRRSTMIDRERDGEGTRDHAARIIQKLDLHRKNPANPQLNPAPAGGIASLISASHNILPVGPSIPTSSGDLRAANMPTSTLAPSTLANPPSATNLSKTAVVVSGERGISLGRADGSGMPSGIMANLWGSTNWGHVNKLQPAGDEPARPAAVSVSQPGSPVAKPVGISTDDVGIMDGMNEDRKDFSSPTDSLAAPPTIRHRKTISLNTAADALRSTERASEEFPNYYPLPLKAQDAQFRILFPDVPRSEKVVLVFRATWNPNEQQEFPGRVYVTTKDIYFFSNHLGLVLVTGVSLSAVTEVTSAPGRDCDFIYIHLKETARYNEPSRVTVKTFLEPLKLLQKRLNYLVINANAEEQASLEEVIKSLIRLEADNDSSTPDLDSWEELSYSQSEEGNLQLPKRRERNLKASLRIDGSLYGAAAGRTGREVNKFKLPSQPVVYSPNGFDHATVVKDFSVSAKALFHVMFGDRSAVFQMMYRNRWANNIVQGPWTQTPENAHFTRTLTLSTDTSTVTTDTQTIDVLNDHLCYVITATQTPWHLPLSSSYLLTTKFVITHTSKSKSKLAIFHRVPWIQRPMFPLARRIVETQARKDLEADAVDLSAVAMEQVAKLGASSKTNKAVQIFGNIGQVATTTTVNVADLPKLSAITVDKVQRRTLPALFADEAAKQVLRIVAALFDIVVALGKSAAGAASAHTVLVVLLATSVLYNTWYGYRDGLGWYHERNAGTFMSRLGVKSDPFVAREVWLKDVETFVAPTVNASDVVVSADMSCRTTFGDVLMASDPNIEAGDGWGVTQSEARLHRTRHSLARYRHDLLVAMRVVNRVEEEVVQAEWEDWVREEGRKCDRVERMLGEKKEKGNGKQQELGGVSREFEEYCRSCRREAESLTKNGTAW